MNRPLLLALLVVSLPIEPVLAQGTAPWAVVGLEDISWPRAKPN